MDDKRDYFDEYEKFEFAQFSDEVVGAKRKHKELNAKLAQMQREIHQVRKEMDKQIEIINIPEKFGQKYIQTIFLSFKGKFMNLVKQFYMNLTYSDSFEKWDIAYYRNQTIAFIEENRSMLNFVLAKPFCGNPRTVCFAFSLPKYSIDGQCRLVWISPFYLNSLKLDDSNDEEVIVADLLFPFSWIDYDPPAHFLDLEFELIQEYTDHQIEEVFQNLPWYEPQLKTIINQYFLVFCICDKTAQFCTCNCNRCVLKCLNRYDPDEEVVLE